MVETYWKHDLTMFLFRGDQISYEWTGAIAGICGLLWLIFSLLVKKKPLSPSLKFFRTGSFWGLFLAIAFSIMKYVGGFRFYTFFFMLSVGFCYLVFRYWSHKGKLMLTPRLLDSYTNYCILGVLIGARLFYLLVYNFDAFVKDPTVIVRTWEGGLSFHGGLLGYIGATILFARRFQTPFWHMTDRLALCIPFALFSVRIGNFFNGELYGRLIQSHIPWAVIFEKTGGGPYPRHPSQIYEGLGEGIGVALLLWSTKFWFKSEGQVSGLFLIFYGCFRYGIEFFREPDPTAKVFFHGAMTTGQLLCLFMILAGSLILVLRRTYVKDGSPNWEQRYRHYLAEQVKLEKSSSH